MQYPLAQERKTCPPISLPFDQFELGHISLNHSVTPLPGETISHCVFVFLDPRSKGLEFGKITAFYLGQPGVEMSSNGSMMIVQNTADSTLWERWRQLR